MPSIGRLDPERISHASRGGHQPLSRLICEYRITAADGVELALHRIEEEGGGVGEAHPLLLAAGTFNGSGFWLGSERRGVAWQLARAGYDVWMVEPRGHGRSEQPARWLLSDWIERDAPAAVEAVVRETGREGVTWVGHSAGGVVGAAFAGTGHPATAFLQRLVLLGTPGPGTVRGRRRWLARLFYLAAAVRRGALLPGEPLKLGPEPESAALVHQWLGWNLAGAWRSPDGMDYLARLHSVRIPVLAVAGSGDDLLAPIGAVRDLIERFGSSDRTLLVAGVDQGMTRDYKHGGMVLARSAGDEIWPRIERWLGETQTAPFIRPDPAELP